MPHVSKRKRKALNNLRGLRAVGRHRQDELKALDDEFSFDFGTSTLEHSESNDALSLLQSSKDEHNIMEIAMDLDMGDSMQPESAKSKLDDVTQVQQTRPATTRNRSDKGTKRCDARSRSVKLYSEKYFSELRFLCCGCCLYEGSRGQFKSLAELREGGYLRWHRHCKQSRLAKLTDRYASPYDHAYAQAYNDAVDEDGMYKGAMFICKWCFNEFKKLGPSSVADVTYGPSAGDNANDATSGSGSEMDIPDDFDNESDADAESESAESCTKANRKPEKTESTSHSSGLANALVFGLIPGSIPPELKHLSTIEISMIALINPLCKMTIKGRSYYEATKPTYTILNDVNDIAIQLPRNLSVADFAILRANNGSVTKEYQYRPARVMAALRYLKANNFLYKDVKIECPSNWKQCDGSINENELDIETINLTEEETDVLEKGSDTCIHTNHLSHHSSGTAMDYLMMSSYNGASNAQVLQDALEDSLDEGFKTLDVDNLVKRVVQRGGQAQFTDSSKQDYFLEMCFPHFFPFGRGGPGDVFSKHIALKRQTRLAKYAKLALTSGGHYRNLQSSFHFLSLCYYNGVRKRMGGVSFAASSKASSIDPVSNNENLQSAFDCSLTGPGLQFGPSLENGIDRAQINAGRSCAITSESVITVGDVNQILDCLKDNIPAPTNLMHLVNRLVPFAKSIPGSAIYFKNERKILQSIVASPVYSKKSWRFFISFSNVDKFEEYLYRWIYSDGNGNICNHDGEVLHGEAAETFLRELTKEKRVQLLRDHPALATRSFMIKQDIIMKYIIKADSTFGHYVDHWCRVEFQRSLNAHMHLILCVDDNAEDFEDFKAKGTTLSDKLAELLQTTCTAELVAPDEVPSALLCQPCTKPYQRCLSNVKKWTCAKFPDSSHFSWKPCNCALAETPEIEHNTCLASDYFDDDEDPRRLSFNPFLDYSRDVNGRFFDKRVQNLYRNLQIANQIHSCCHTCFKYCITARICRFGFPRREAELRESLKTQYPETDDPFATAMARGYIHVRSDASGRKRCIFVPPFNNAHINNHAFDPFLFIAQHANMDVKYMDNKSGTVEYICSYASKTEQPDFSKISNIYIKKMAGLTRNGRSITDLQKLNAVGNALIDSELVGAPQMCYFLIGLPLVIFSRSIERINSLQRNSIHVRLKGQDERESSAAEASAVTGDSHLAKRAAYGAFIVHNMSLNDSRDPGQVTFFSLRTSYTSKAIKQISSAQSTKQNRIPLLDHLLSTNKATGEISDCEKSFRIADYLFIKRRKSAIIHLSPHIPFDSMDERSAYSTLLLHHIWPNGDENQIVPYGRSAVDVLKEAQLLEHVKQIVQRHEQSEAHISRLRQDQQLSSSARRRTQQLLEQQTRYEDNDTTDSINGIHASDLDDGSDDDNIPYNSPQNSDDEIADFEDSMDKFNHDEQLLDMSNKAIQLSPLQYHTAIQFIETAKSLWTTQMQDVANEQEISVALQATLHANADLPYIPVDNLRKRKADLKQMVQTLDLDHTKAFSKVKQALPCKFGQRNYEQLVMFVSGEGGSGKSHFINTISEYGSVMYGKTRGTYGIVVKWAPTGASAFNIGGCTWQSGIKKQQYTKGESDKKYRQIAKEFQDARLLILDEISMIGLEDLYLISSTIAKALATLAVDNEKKDEILQSPFGGLHVIYAGDLYQLPAIKRTAIFSKNYSKFAAQKGKELWMLINFYVKFIENHRINKNDQVECMFAAALSILREGGHSAVNGVLRYLHTHNLATNEAECIEKAHRDALWLAPFRHEVATVNGRFFQELVTQGNMHYRCIAFHTCTEQAPTEKELNEYFKYSDVQKFGATYVDLAVGSRVRCTHNLAQKLGIYHGATGTVIKIAFLDSTESHKFSLLPKSATCGSLAKQAFNKRPLPVVYVRMDNDKISEKIIPDRIVPFVAEERVLFKRGKNVVKRLQIPLELAHASTIHSCQGATAKSPGGVVFNRTKKQLFAAGLCYVALSRCQSIRDLILQIPISLKDFSTHMTVLESIKNEYKRLELAFPQRIDSNELYESKKRIILMQIP